MTKSMFKSLVLIFILLFTPAWAIKGEASGLLDGKAFVGMIGPAENPDLPDSLHFDDGHFWSDICSRCGFVPGTYRAVETENGIAFNGTLQSESRGRFDYVGTVGMDGAIIVSIAWERRRWYWTSKREIIFVGQLVASRQTVSLSNVRSKIRTSEPEGNPLCARF